MPPVQGSGTLVLAYLGHWLTVWPWAWLPLIWASVSSLVSGAGWTSLGSTNRNSPGGQVGDIGVRGARRQGVQ